MPQFIRETPYANPLTGLSNDVIQGLLGYMKDKQRTQQMQGLASLLESTGIPKTVERAAYAESPTGLLNALTNVNRANVPLLKPETADALMTLAPVPSGANKAAMTVGRAGERYAEKVVPQILERGGLPAEMVQAMGSNTRSLLDVWHGTPHTLPPTAKNPLGEFDASKIGTGEGSQSYGYGMYFAENPDVAKSYVKTGMRPIFKVGDENIIPVKNPITPEEKARNYIYDNAETAMVESNKKPSAQSLLNDSWMDAKYAFKGEELNLVRNEIARLIEAKGKKVLKNQEGSLYKVDLPDEKIAKMLDWDAPLKDQTPEIQALAKEYKLTDDDHFGGDLVAAMDAKRAAGAEKMRQAGVTGIKYFDQGSRGIEDGTRNFILFPTEEKSLTILERNGLLADQFQALPEKKKKEILSLLDY